MEGGVPGLPIRSRVSNDRRAFLMAMFVGAVGFGCRTLESGQRAASDGSTITIENVWSIPTFGTVAAARGRIANAAPADATRAAALNQVNGVVYCIIKNHSETTDRLLTASSSVARAVEFHETIIEQSVARMRPAGSIEIIARGQIEFKPTKLHMMLVDVQRELQPGERIPLILQFERAGPRTVESEVRG